MDAIQVGELIAQPYKQHGDYIVTNCYNTAGHSRGDSTPSLTIYDGERGYYCYACGESGSHSWLLKVFGVPGYTNVASAPRVQRETKATVKKTYTTYPLMEIWKSLPELPKKVHKKLEAKGWTIGDFQNTAGWRWHTKEIPGWPEGAFIPYFNADRSELIGARLRLFNETGPRFLSLPGGESFGYMLSSLTKPRCYMTEGETDCLTLNFLGIPAVGIPGATNSDAITKTMTQAKELGTFIVVVPDNDEAGEKFLERIRVAAFEHKVPMSVFRIPETKDVNDYFVSVGREKFEEYFLADSEDDILVPILNQQEKLL